MQCTQLARHVRKERIPASARKALRLSRTTYDSLGDMAVLNARLEETKRLKKTSAGEAIIGDDYQFVRNKPLSHDRAVEKLRGAAQRSVKKMVRKYVVTKDGETCDKPCKPRVRFQDGEVDIQCRFEHRFTRNASVEAIQKEVLRIAKILGIKPVKLQTDNLTSACKKGKKGGRKGAGPAPADPTPAQRVMSEIDAPFLMEPFKGALMWHTVGAGKSCAAMLVANTFLNKGWRVVWASTAQLKFQPAVRHFFDVKCHDQDMPSPLPTSQKAREEYLTRKVLDVASYSTLTNGLARPGHSFGKKLRGGIAKGKNDPLYRTLIIMDEPHKMREMTGNQKASLGPVATALHHSYEKSGEDSGRILFMDATPAVSEPGELIEMLNAMEPDKSKHMPTDGEELKRKGFISDAGITEKGRDAFRQLGKGVISYLNMSADATRFARPVRWTLNRVAMSETQLKKAEACDFAKNKRQCVEANSVAMNMPAGKFGAKMVADLKKREDRSFPLLKHLVANIETLDEEDDKEHGKQFKHAIFTNVPNAGHANNIAKVLQAAGFTPVDIDSPARDTGGRGYVMLSGSGLTPNRKAAITKFFNDPKNANGKYARFLLLDGRFREGVDVFDTRHFHMLQPLQKLEERQAIGRVLRMCGSTNLPSGDNVWQVRVHLYDAIDAADNTSLVHKHDLFGDVGAATVIAQLEDEARQIAFDHLLFRGYSQKVAKEEFKSTKVVTEHLPCEGEVAVGLRCSDPNEEPKRHKKTGIFCCEPKPPACGKKAEPAENGKCPKGFIAGPGENDPDTTCCYKLTTKRGKELKAAAANKKLVPVRVPRQPASWPKCKGYMCNQGINTAQGARKHMTQAHPDRGGDPNNWTENVTPCLKARPLPKDWACPKTKAKKKAAKKTVRTAAAPATAPNVAKTKKGKERVPCPRLKTQALGPDKCPPGFAAFRSLVNPDVTCCKKK